MLEPNTVLCRNCSAPNHRFSKACLICRKPLQQFVNAPKSIDEDSPWEQLAVFCKRNPLIMICLISIFGVYVGTEIGTTFYQSAQKYLSVSGADSSKAAPVSAQSQKDGKVTVAENAWFNQTWVSWTAKNPTVEQIIAKNNEVVGDMDAVRNALTVKMNGTISIATAQNAATDLKSQLTNDDFARNSYTEFGNVDVSMKSPAKVLFQVKGSRRAPAGSIGRYADVFIESSEGFNGTDGWHKQFVYTKWNVIKDTFEELKGEKLKKLQMKSLKQLYENISTSRFRYIGLATVNENVCYMLQRQTEEKELQNLYFDTVSGQLIKADTADFQMYFSDFKKFGDIVLPGHWYYQMREPDGVMWMRIELREWKWNENIDDQIFEKPAAAKTRL